MEITLDRLLESRENRRDKQIELIEKHPSFTLICLTVIMPGKVKRNFHSLIVAEAALYALKKRFENEIKELVVRDLQTGYEAFILVSIPELETKLATCEIEEKHPLGRLFDIDVISKTGIPIPRNIVGKSPRKCLLCDKESRFCMRNHSHTQEELYGHISKIIDDYVR